MDDDLVQLVWDRAGSICEYCLLPQEYSHLTFEVDHIIATCHGRLALVISPNCLFVESG
jgi:hypothetical protein